MRKEIKEPRRNRESSWTLKDYENAATTWSDDGFEYEMTNDSPEPA